MNFPRVPFPKYTARPRTSANVLKVGPMYGAGSDVVQSVSFRMYSSFVVV